MKGQPPEFVSDLDADDEDEADVLDATGGGCGSGSSGGGGALDSDIVGGVDGVEDADIEAPVVIAGTCDGNSPELEAPGVLEGAKRPKGT